MLAHTRNWTQTTQEKMEPRHDWASKNHFWVPKTIKYTRHMKEHLVNTANLVNTTGLNKLH